MNNVRRYHLITFLTNLSFGLPIWVFFGTEYLQLSNFQTYLLGSFYMLTSTIFEIPTGSWADRYGRKKIYGFGLVFTLVSILAYILTKNFYLLLLSQVINGFAVALKSGPLTSLVYDWLKSKKLEDTFGDITSDNLTFLFVGRIIGGVVGGYAYTLLPTLPYILLFVVIALALIILTGMHESSYKSKGELSELSLIKQALARTKQLFTQKEFLLIVGGATVFSALGNTLWYTYQPYFKSLKVSPDKVGFLYIFISLSSAIGSQIVKKLMKKVNNVQIIMYMLFLTAIVSILMSLMNLTLGMIGILILSVIFGFRWPITNRYLHKKFESEYRVTITSIFGMMTSLVLFLVSTSTGYMLDILNLNFLYTSVLILSTTMGIVIMIGKGNKLKA